MEINHEALDFLRKRAVEKNRLTQKAFGVSDETLIRNPQVLTNDGQYTVWCGSLKEVDDVWIN